MTAAGHSWYMMVRHLRALWRQPVWIFVAIAQPIIWLLLFGAVFKTAAYIPGFGDQSYVDYITPGVVVMSAFFSAGWSGMAMIEDIERDVVDRFLASPTRRIALITGRVMQQAVVIAIQSLIIVALALVLGAELPNGVGGVLGMIVVAALLGAGVAALSNGLALIVRKEETLIATVNGLLLPLAFLSTAFMPEQLLPDWVSTIATFNPLNWAVEASRYLVGGDGWGAVAHDVGLLAALAIACAAFAVRAFKAYQASL